MEEAVLNKCEKYWFKVNKKHLTADCCAAALLTAIGGGRLIAVIIYMMAVEICAMNYLNVFHFSGGADDALNLVKTLSVERRVFYDTYIKMMLLQTAAFAAVFALGTFAGNISGADLPLVPQVIFKKRNSHIGCRVLHIAAGACNDSACRNDRVY